MFPFPFLFLFLFLLHPVPVPVPAAGTGTGTRNQEQEQSAFTAQVRIFFLMVGHTHIIIDQIFGVITVAMRGKEILLPSQLIHIINTAVDANPQYQPHPVEWLHSIFDFWAFRKQLKPLTLDGIFKRPTIVDEDGRYYGMCDFLFTRSVDKLALLQYREQWDFPLQPADSPGAQVIRALPTSPPDLKRILPFEKWGKIGVKTILTTIATYLQYTRSTKTVHEEKVISDGWSLILKEIPSVIDVLKAEYKLTFDDWDYNAWNAIPRLLTNQRVPVPAGAGAGTGTGTGTGTEAPITDGEEEEMSRVTWRRLHFMGHRTTPFAYDPVVNTENSATNFANDRSRYEASLLGGAGPTISISSLCFSGRFILARPGSQGLSLFKIEDIGRMMTPRSLHVNLSCTSWLHVPQNNVPGFFGTVRQAPAGTSKQLLTRSDVLVYNVDLFVYKKLRYLSLPSLRELARKDPNYGIPSRIPKSHFVPDEDANGDVVESSDHDSSDPDDDEGGRSRRKKPKPKVKRVKPKRKNRFSSEGQGYEEEDLNPDLESVPVPRTQPGRGAGPSAGYGNEDDDDEEEEAGEEGEDGEDDERTGDDSDSSAPDDRPPRVPKTPFVPRAGTLVFINMKDSGYSDPRIYPATLVLVEKILEGGSFMARWYADINWSTRAKLSSKNVSFPKYWTVTNVNKAMGLRKGGKPSLDQVKKYWAQEPDGLCFTTCIPLEVPGPSEEVIWAADTIQIPGAFLREQLVPACRKGGLCVRTSSGD